MVRPSYRANLAGDNGQPFFGFIFDPSQEGRADPDDLRGGARAARRFVGWQTFFDFGDGEVKPNKRIDTKISTPLFKLPLGAIATHDAPTALPQRNLLRHLTWQLPSGQSVARTHGRHAAGAGRPRRSWRRLGVGFEHSTPLWYYVLKEAEVVADGLHLGPGRRPHRRPRSSSACCRPIQLLPRRRTRAGGRPCRARRGTFRMTDFLTFAGVDPQSRGQ